LSLTIRTPVSTASSFSFLIDISGPSTNQFVDVNYGEEYIVNLSFDPAGKTLAASAQVCFSWHARAPALYDILERSYL